MPPWCVECQEVASLCAHNVGSAYAHNKKPLCPHGFTVDDPNPHNLCPFCPQPNRVQIVKAWDEKQRASVRPK